MINFFNFIEVLPTIDSNSTH